MTREECVRDLKGSMELYLFDPDTGEVLIPEQLNDMNRMTYEAMKKAVELLGDGESDKMGPDGRKYKRKELMIDGSGGGSNESCALRISMPEPLLKDVEKLSDKSGVSLEEHFTLALLDYLYRAGFLNAPGMSDGRVEN